MTTLPPWAIGPFELIVHGEIHFRVGNDFDRRISLISFDNAIEAAITTYLTLHPIQRRGSEYANHDVDQWMKNYHAKIEFFEKELKLRNLVWLVEKSHIIWAHDHRNEQYHGGKKGTPEVNVLQVARTAALWVFSVLFYVDDADDALEQAVLNQLPPVQPSQVRDFDVAIDGQYGIIAVGGQSYYASELLFAIDYVAYRDIGMKLIDGPVEETGDEAES